MYQSNRSLNMPPGIPRAFDVFSCPGGREFDEVSLPGAGHWITTHRGWGIRSLASISCDESRVKIMAETRGAFHSTKISGLTYRNFHMSNGTVFSTSPDRSCSIPASTHFTRQNAEGSWKSGCFKHRKLLPRNKFNTYKILPQYLPDLTESNTMRATCELYAREGSPGSMQTERTKPQEIRNDQSTIFQKIRSKRGE